MGRPKVFCTRKMPEVAFELAREVADVEVWEDEQAPPRDVLLAKAADCDGLITLLTEPVNEELFAAAPRLRIVAQMAVGFNNIDVPAATRRGIVVTNTPGVLTDTVVESTLGLLIAAGRRIAEADRYVRDGSWVVEWHPLMMLGQDICGSTVGIVGLGRIGRKVADVLLLLGANIVYTDAYPQPEYEAANAGRVRRAELAELCRVSDFISLHCDLNPGSRHLIGEPEIALMKRNCVIVNTARGPIIDQEALTRALAEHRIGAAGLDVFEKEPLSSDHPLCKLENVVLLPHLGSASLGTRTNMARLVGENIRSFFSGRLPPNALNPEAFNKL